MKTYKLGFSPIGCMAVLLVMIPNLLYFFAVPPSDVLSANEADFILWNVLENIGRFGTMLTLCVVVNQHNMRKVRYQDALAWGSLCVYVILWSLYFIGWFNGVSLVGLALFPSLFFMLVAWKLRNMPALLFAALFAVLHIGITCSNFLC